ncbi:MAG: response regulator [Phototrophicaceae bacterium]
MAEYTILSIDDDASARMLFEMMLTRSGFDFLQAEDADAALEVLETVIPDLIMTDIQLPGKSGIELVAELRQRDDLDQTAIMVLSAFQSETMVEDAMRAGADDFFRKPLPMKELTKILTDLIHKRRGE